MQFSAIIVAAFAAMTIAAPILKPRAAVLATTSYDDLSVSGGVSGDAEAEVLAKFSALDLNDMANIDAADLDFLGAVNDVGNQAEKEFNTAIAAATGDAKIALQNGKTKNKVLKLKATVIELTAKAAQGEDTAAKLAAETKKLNNNIGLDKAAAGQPSTSVAFDATIEGGGAGTATAPAEAATTTAASTCTNQKK